MAGKITPEKIEQVRMASDIVEVVSRYLTLRKSGKNYFGLCPFHKEKTPSFSVNSEKQIFHCFGCGEGGNVFNFVMRIESLSFPESIRLLAKQAGIDIPQDDTDVEHYRQKEALYYVNNLAASFYLENLLTSPQANKAREYLKGRGLGPEQFKTFNIGFALEGWDNLLNHTKAKTVKPETLYQAGLVLQNQEGGYYDRFRGRITFAIHNTSGQIVGFGARRIINDNSPKYINTPETEIYQKRQVLYNLYNARESIREHDRVVIVEGYTDVTSLYKKNIHNIVATSGTALTSDHAVLLHRYTKNATLMFDGDSAGAAAAIRGADILMQNGMDVSICLLSGGQDPDDFASNNPTETIAQTIQSAEPYVDYRLRHLQNLKSDNSAARKSEMTRDLLGTFAKITDPIKQAYMVKELAEKLTIDESLLWNEIKKFQRHIPMPAKEPVKPVSTDSSFFKSKRGAAELGLLVCAFLNPSLIAKILENLDIAMLSHPEIQQFYQSLEASPPDPMNFDATRYMTMIQDNHIAKTLSQLMTETSKTEHINVPKLAYDCILTIQLSVVDHEIQIAKASLQNIMADDAAKIQEHILNLYARKKEISAGQYINNIE